MTLKNRTVLSFTIITIRFSTQGANLLLIAQERALIGERGAFQGPGTYMLFFFKICDMIQNTGNFNSRTLTIWAVIVMMCNTTFR